MSGTYNETSERAGSSGIFWTYEHQVQAADIMSAPPTAPDADAKDFLFYKNFTVDQDRGYFFVRVKDDLPINSKVEVTVQWTKSQDAVLFEQTVAWKIRIGHFLRDRDEPLPSVDENIIEDKYRDNDAADDRHIYIPPGFILENLEPGRCYVGSIEAITPAIPGTPMSEPAFVGIILKYLRTTAPTDVVPQGNLFPPPPPPPP